MERQDQENKTRKMPIIGSDIDGVILHRRNVIEGVKESMEFLQENKQIPFMLMTNRGGYPEAQLAVDINKVYGMDEEHKLEGDQVLMNHSPMIPIFDKLKNEMILIITRDKNGVERGKLQEFMKYIGINKYITGDEYCNLYPQLVPLSKRTKEAQQTTLEDVSKRTGIPEDILIQKPIQIKAIFMFLVPLTWEENLQIILDLLSTENGEIADKLVKGPKNHIPVYSGFNDLTFKGHMELPRLIMGGFSQSLKVLYKQLYDDDLKIIQYGKPQTIAFEFLEKTVNEKYKTKMEGNKYFIGDNPASDIQGANNAPGWTSILVRTGVWNDGENDKENPGKYVVNNFKEAIQLICKLENIDCSKINEQAP